MTNSRTGTHRLPRTSEDFIAHEVTVTDTGARCVCGWTGKNKAQATTHRRYQ